MKHPLYWKAKNEINDMNSRLSLTSLGSSSDDSKFPYEFELGKLQKNRSGNDRFLCNPIKIHSGNPESLMNVCFSLHFDYSTDGDKEYFVVEPLVKK